MHHEDATCRGSCMPIDQRGGRGFLFGSFRFHFPHLPQPTLDFLGTRAIMYTLSSLRVPGGRLAHLHQGVRLTQNWVPPRLAVCGLADTLPSSGLELLFSDNWDPDFSPVFNRMPAAAPSIGRLPPARIFRPSVIICSQEFVYTEWWFASDR